MRSTAVLKLIAGIGVAGCGAGDSAAPDLTTRVSPRVASTDPPGAPRNTTLDVRINGSNFEEGSRAVWALGEDTTYATTRIRTNSTTFASSTQLIASITIEADAAVDRHDVVVLSAGGKKGIGLEIFAVTMEVIDLGAGAGSSADAVNDRGQVVGTTGGLERRAFLWENGKRIDLGALPGDTHSEAYDINQHGAVVGTSCDIATTPVRCRPVRWDSGVISELIPPFGYCCGGAQAINDRGDAAGWVQTGTGEARHAAFWPAGRVAGLDLQLPRSGESIAEDINNQGSVVGYYRPVQNEQAGTGSVIWTAPDYQMAFLGGVPDHGGAIGINDLGQVVGWASPTGSPDIASFPLIAYVWKDGTRQYLGTLGGRSSVAMEVNEEGLVVGRADTDTRGGDHGQLAFLWSAESGMGALDVRSPGIDRGWGLDVNAQGWVAGVTWGPTGHFVATLWRTR